MNEDVLNPLVGWGSVSAVLIFLGILAAWVNMKRGRVAKALYFFCIVLVPLAALAIGVCAGLADKSFLTAYATVMVAGGTLAQICLDLSKKDNSPFVGTHKTIGIPNRLLVDADGKEHPDVAGITRVVVGEDETRDTLRAGGWSLIFVGALAGVWAVFA